MSRVRTLVLTAGLLAASFAAVGPAPASTCETNLGAVGDAACAVVSTGVGTVDGVCARVTKQTNCLD